MDGFLAKLVKYLLFITNFLVFVMAVAVLGIAIAMVSGKAAPLVDLIKAVDDTININLYAASAVMLIVVSALVIVVTFLGCCGALKENRCMLGLYFAVLLAMFVAMIVGAVIGYSQPFDEIKKAMLDSVPKYDPTSTSTTAQAITKSWDEMQKGFECCGVDKYQDWDLNPKVAGVPKSCCEGRSAIDNVDTCAATPSSVDVSLLPGCYQKIETYVEDNSKTIMTVAIIAVVVMFLNMIFAFAMCTMAD